MASVAWNFWHANCEDEKGRSKLERDMYEPIARLPFSVSPASVNDDGWAVTAWIPGQRGKLVDNG